MHVFQGSPPYLSTALMNEFLWQLAFPLRQRGSSTVYLKSTRLGVNQRGSQYVPDFTVFLFIPGVVILLQ